MRIALVTNGFLPLTGGGEFVVHHLANQWSKLGHEVYVFNSYTDKATHPEALYKVKRYRIMRGATRFGYHRTPWLNVSVQSLNRLINDFNPDFISGHFAIPVAFYLANLKPKRKWIITSHGADVVANLPDSQRKRYDIDRLLGKVLNDATGVVSISQIAQKSLEELGVNKTKINYIPNGVEIDRFKSHNGCDFRQLNKIPVDSKYILTIARNSAQKNLLLGVRAFAEIVRSHQNLYYVIAGSGTKNLTPYINECGIQNKIIIRELLVGDELIAAYQQAALFLSTSVWEFCPLVILESMAAGLPQVATNVPGSNELILDGETGILVESNDHLNMANAIAVILENNALREKMREANLQKAKSYSWDYISNKYLELFSQ